MLAVPTSQEAASLIYKDNTAEYKERYKRPEPSIYQTQFYFLRKLAAFCRKEKIQLILVNMPLTRANISLLSPTIYLQYLQALKKFGYDQNIAVLDLCTWSDYTQADFHDSVHLNAFGGKKFIYRLVENLAKLPRTRKAMLLAGEELKLHEDLLDSSRLIGKKVKNQ
jgi:hypothetical protein